MSRWSRFSYFMRTSGVIGAGSGSQREEWSWPSDTEQRWRGYFEERGVNIVAELDG
jgi:hypothetical protein